MKHSRTLYLAKVLLIGLPLVAQASQGDSTLISRQKTDWHRLIPLKKLTVGPDDQYFAAPSPNGNSLVFSHKADLVARLRIQDLASGDVQDLLPQGADSQEAVFHPDGRLAFNYFRWSARGDICWTPDAIKGAKQLKESEIRCLKRSFENTRSSRSNPFWAGQNELGYLERDFDSQDSKKGKAASGEGITAKVIVENISTGARRVLRQGKLWTPFMRPGGRFLVFNQWVDGSDTRKMVLKDLRGEYGEIVVKLSLPGISGFPILSQDEQYLYFSHFINDTNADHSIDGSDNAVVFRIPIAKLLADKAQAGVFPEQLTSVETSCSFPVPNDSLYLTCAFEGSLDIYQVPLSGVVPSNWNGSAIKNAIDTVRSYQDRILLNNVRKYRFEGSGDFAIGGLDETLLGDHLLAGDLLAGKFYVEKLKQNLVKKPETQQAEIGVLSGLEIYLDAQLLKAQLPTEELTAEFKQNIQKLEKNAQNLKGASAFSEVLRAYLRFSVGDKKSAAQILGRLHFARNEKPAVRIIYFDLAEKLIGSQSVRDQLELTAKLYREQILREGLSDQAKIYYGFRFLEKAAAIVKTQAQTFGQTLEKNEHAERIRIIEKTAVDLPAPVSDLLKSEVAVLKIIDAPDTAAKYKAYPALDKFFISSRGNYFQRRALYVRAVTNFAESSDFVFLGFVGDNWLKYTDRQDTEYAFAREFFLESSYDRAYDDLAAGKLELAANYFYQAASTADDLEAHYGYITTRIRMNQRSVVDTRYKYATAHQLIGDNIKFVDAVLALADDDQEKNEKPLSTKQLDRAIGLLNSMIDERDSAMRYLVLGYCYLEKFLRLSDGVEIDNGLFEDAHRALMLAYDLGKDRDRIKASAMVNLGILHERAQNFGLAGRFLELRKRLGFVSEKDQERVEWLYARALEFTHQHSAAVKELSEVPKDLQTVPVVERRAFNLVLANEFNLAAESYGQLEVNQQGEFAKFSANSAKLHMMFGYSLLKAGKSADAAKNLRRAFDESGKLTSVKRDRDHLLDFDPMRLQLISSGLLARAAQGDEKVSTLDKRYQLLSKIDGSDLQRIQNRVEMAHALLKADPSRSRLSILEAVRIADDYGRKNQFLGLGIFNTSEASLLMALKFQKEFTAEDKERINNLANNFLTAVQKQKAKDPNLQLQVLKIKLVTTGLAGKSQGIEKGALNAQLESILASGEAAELKALLPEVKWTEILNLSHSVLTLALF
jgi:hypothetical protein